MRLRAAGENDAAMAIFIELTVKCPHQIKAYLEAGRTRYIERKPSESMKWFRKAGLVAPGNFWPYYRQAEVLASLGEYEPALDAIELGLVNCKGKVSELEYTNLTKRFIDIRALAIERSGLAIPPFLTAVPNLGRPIPDGLHVAVIKDEEDIIFASLEASYRAGVRYFALADNASCDTTRSEIERFKATHKDCIVFLLTDPVIGYYQAAKTMALTRMATTVLAEMSIKINWIFPIDADEMLYVSPSMEDIAEVLDKDVNRAKAALVYYHHNAYSQEIYEALPAGADVLSLFPKFARLDRVPVRKIAFRNLDSAYVEMGAHFCSGLVASPDDVIHGSEIGIFLRHFPTRSVKQLRTKIKNGGEAVSALDDPGICAHWRADFDKYKATGDAYLLHRIQAYIRTSSEG